MKTDRAKEQLDELERSLQDFIENPYTVTRKDDDKKLRHIIRCEFRPMPYTVGMLVGEFAYSLRSGLDQLAWQLARIHITPPARPRTHTCFPIFASAPLKGFGDKTRDILPAAIPVIESFQPYQRGPGFKSHPLYELNELCIIDKHMITPINSTAGKINISGADYASRDLHYGFEVVVHLTDKYKVKLQPTQSEIIFGEPIGRGNSGFEIRIAGLRAIHEFVGNDVIPRFAGFFK